MPRAAKRNRKGNSSRLDLQDLIREEGLQIGDRLPSIREIAEKTGVRPHRVRDALVQAQSLGWVRIVPRSGAIVERGGKDAADVDSTAGVQNGRESDHHTFHLLEARQLIELALAEQAARRRRVEDLLPIREALDAMNAIRQPDGRPAYVEQDLQFHLGIARVAGNPVLTGMLKSVLNALRPLLSRLPFDDAMRLRTQRSHAEIYRALVEGDAARVRECMTEHLRMAYDSLLGEVQSLPA